MIEKFREIVENRHQYAQDWKKRTGKKVVGYLCTYVPEEIIYAAGLLPVRVMGSHESSSISDTHIAWVYCPHSRDVLAEGLKGRYNYLDGLVKSYGCNHMRQALWSWQEHVKTTTFFHHLYVPYYIEHPSSKALVVEEMRKFKFALETFTKKTISDKDLDRAIDIYNKNRRLLRQIYELGKGDNPPLTGVELMEIMLAGMYMDKEEHNQMLEQLLEEIKGRDVGNGSKVRIMILGTVCDDMEIVRLIDSLGGNVVADDLCTGSRYFWEEIKQEEDRFAAITDRYLHKPLCPIRDLEANVRITRIQQMIDDYKIQGLIVAQQRFCEPLEYDLSYMLPIIHEKGIHTLLLELDVTNPVGQFRTRIEAFIETLQPSLI